MPSLLVDPATEDVVRAQWLFCAADLEYTPTVTSGLMKASEERTRRRKGVSLIYKVAERLGLMSHVIGTAALFFHRFFMRRQMRPIGHVDRPGAIPSFAYQDVALAALYLATKVEESYRKLDDIVTSGAELETRVSETTEPINEAMLRRNILWCEERLLETLCFDLIMEHPQKHLILAGRKLGVDKPLIRIAYAHLHDAFRDPVCTFYEAPVLAAGAFALACQDAEADPMTFASNVNTGREGSSRGSAKRNWLQVFDVDQDEVDAVVRELKEVRDTMLTTERSARPPLPAAVSMSASRGSGSIGLAGTQSGLNSPSLAPTDRSQNPSTVPSLNGTPLLRAGHGSSSVSGASPTPQPVAPVDPSTSSTDTPHTSVLPPPALERAEERAGMARPPTRHSGPVSPRPFGAPRSATRTVAGTAKDEDYTPMSPVLSQPAVSSEEQSYVPVSPPTFASGGGGGGGDGASEEGEIAG